MKTEHELKFIKSFVDPKHQDGRRIYQFSQTEKTIHARAYDLILLPEYCPVSILKIREINDSFLEVVVDRLDEAIEYPKLEEGTECKLLPNAYKEGDKSYDNY